MFRKLTHIFLSLLLLISTCGIAYTRHFCGQELVAIQWFSADDESNEDDCCGGMENSCCQDELVQINPVQTEVTINSVQNVVPSFSDALTIGYPVDCYDSYHSVKFFVQSPTDDGPPLFEDIVLVNRCFII